MTSRSAFFLDFRVCVPGSGQRNLCRGVNRDYLKLIDTGGHWLASDGPRTSNDNFELVFLLVQPIKLCF